MSDGGVIYLVRHGEAAASWGQSADPGLSPLGRSQAENLAEELVPALEGTRPRLISSPLARARETAMPLAAALGMRTDIDERFREIPSPVPLEQRQHWLRAFMRELWSRQEPPLHEWRRAIADAVHEQKPPTVVFTHFLVINTIVGLLEQRDETLVFWPDNTSVTEVTLADGKLRVAALGKQMKTVVN